MTFQMRQASAFATHSNRRTGRRASRSRKSLSAYFMLKPTPLSRTNTTGLSASFF